MVYIEIRINCLHTTMNSHLPNLPFTLLAPLHHPYLSHLPLLQPFPLTFIPISVSLSQHSSPGSLISVPHDLSAKRAAVAKITRSSLSYLYSYAKLQLSTNHRQMYHSGTRTRTRTKKTYIFLAVDFHLI